MMIRNLMTLSTVCRTYMAYRMSPSSTCSLNFLTFSNKALACSPSFLSRAPAVDLSTTNFSGIDLRDWDLTRLPSGPDWMVLDLFMLFFLLSFSSESS
ncbi:rCG37963, isoform CRA_b, partial [Rattus norvegicus]